MLANYAHALHVAATNVLMASQLAYASNREIWYRHASFVGLDIYIPLDVSLFLHKVQAF